MASIAETGERMLRLLALLQGRRDWEGLYLRRGWGQPTDAPAGRRPSSDTRLSGGCQSWSRRRLSPGYWRLVAPLLLDDDEAVALVLALRSMANTPVVGAAEAWVAALAKVVGVLPARLRRQDDVIAEATVATADAQTVIDGWGAGRPLSNRWR